MERYSITEASNILNISRQLVSKRAKSNGVTLHKIGTKKYISKEDLETLRLNVTNNITEQKHNVTDNVTVKNALVEQLQKENEFLKERLKVAEDKEINYQKMCMVYQNENKLLVDENKSLLIEHKTTDNEEEGLLSRIFNRTKKE